MSNSFFGNFPQLKSFDRIMTRTITNVSSFSILNSDISKLLLVDASISEINISLPNLATVGKDFTFWIKKIDISNNKIVVTAAGSQTINGNNIYTLSGRNSAIGISSTGTEWRIISFAGMDTATTTKNGAIQYSTKQEVSDLLVTTKTISPANIKQFFQNGSVTEPLDSSLLTNGYSELPGGLIIQWGSLTVPTSGTPFTFNFPISFPNGVLQGFAGRNAPFSVFSSAIYGQGVSLLNLTQNSAQMYLITTPNGGSVSWYVLGY